MSLPGSFKDLRKQDMVKWSESQMSGTTHADALFGSDGRWALRLHQQRDSQPGERCRSQPFCGHAFCGL